jgi:hypothetical protein
MSKFLKICGALAVFALLSLVGLLIYVQVNQQELIKQVKAKLDQSINGELSIGNIQLNILNDFPRLSLTLHDLSVKDSAYKKEIFVANRIFLRMNLLQLLRKQIDFSKVTLEGGKFFLLRDSSGYLNADLLKSKSSGKTSLDFDLKELDIRDLQFSFHENQRGQHICFTIVKLYGIMADSGLTPMMHLSGSMHVDSMMFKPDRGSFFKDKLAGMELNMSFDHDKKQLVIHPSKFEIDRQFYDGKGYFDFSHNPGFLDLEFSNPKTDFTVAKGILSDVILGYMKGIELNDSVDVKVVVRGAILPDFPPEIDAYFNLNNANMTYSGIHLTGFTVKGLFMNHVQPGVKNDDSNSALKFEVPSVKVEGIPLSASMIITDLKALHLAVTASSQTPLATISNVLPQGGGKFTDGNVDLSLTYHGTLSAYLPATARKGEDTLSGYLKIKNGAYVYPLRGLELKSINTDVAFDQLKMDIKDLSASLNGNQLAVKGYLDGVSRLISNNNQKMTGNLVLSAPVFNLSKVLTEKNISEIAAIPKDTSTNSGKVASAAIGQLIDDITLRLNFSSNLFTFRKFKAQKVRGEVTISTRGLYLKDFNLNLCKGGITVNGALQTGGAGADKLAGEVHIKNVNMQQFLSDADNFDQTAITAENLNGNLSADVHFSAPLDTGYVPLTDSMKGDIYFSLKEGHITNFAPLADIGKTIFKKRDFKNVTFDEIKDSVILTGMDLTIHRMEIASSIFRMFIQGRYKINGSADVTIQVPLSNLKKQDLNYTPANIGTDAKTGANIYLRLRGGGKEKIKISLDAGAKSRLKKEGLL